MKIRKDQDMISKIPRDISELKRQIQNISVTLNEEDDTGNLRSEWENSIRQIDEEIARLEERKMEIKAQMVEIDESTAVVQEEIEKLQQEHAGHSAKFSGHEDTLKKCGVAMENAQGREHKLKAEIRTLNERKDSIGSTIDDQKRILGELTETASTHSERVPIDAQDTHEKLEKQIAALKQIIDQERQGQRSVGEIKKDFEAANSRVKEVKGQLAILTTLRDRVERHLSERRKLWAFLLTSQANRTNNSFRCLISQKGFDGELIFDHQGKKLDIQVRPHAQATEKDTNSLSGGERSFSTVSLLMAIWGVMDSPLCALDEFDVFMDLSVRKKSIDLLIELGLTQTDCQFLFLSPGDKTQIPSAGKDIRVFEMTAPDRAQGVLPFRNGNNEDD